MAAVPGVRVRQRVGGGASYDGFTHQTYGPAHSRQDLAEMDRDRMEAAFAAGGLAQLLQLRTWLMRAAFAVAAANSAFGTGYKHVTLSRTPGTYELTLSVPDGSGRKKKATTSHLSLEAALAARDEAVRASSGGDAGLQELHAHDAEVLGIMRRYKDEGWARREEAPDPGRTFWARVASSDGGISAARAWLLEQGPAPPPHQLRSAEFEAAVQRGVAAFTAEHKRATARLVAQMHKRALPAAAAARGGGGGGGGEDEEEEQEEQQQQQQQGQRRGRPVVERSSTSATVLVLRQLGHDQLADTARHTLEEEAAARAAAAAEAARQERYRVMGEQLMAAALPPALAKGLAALDVFARPGRVSIEDALAAVNTLVDAMLAHRVPALAEAVAEHGPRLLASVVDGRPRPRRALDALHQALVAAGALVRPRA